MGYDRSGFRADGVRTGAALVSREPMGPGRYEVSVRVPTELGAVSSIWTFQQPFINLSCELPQALFPLQISKFGNREPAVETELSRDFRSSAGGGVGVE